MVIRYVFLGILLLVAFFAQGQQNYQYTNFDGAAVDINLQINPSFLEYSNRGWKELVQNDRGSALKNYFALVEEHFDRNRDSLRFVYQMFDSSLYQVSDAYFINTVIRFVQSIPYQIPPTIYKGKETSGLLSPAISLAEGYGDCDTKSILLACILGHRYEILFLAGAQHAFIGIKIPPLKGQEFVEINGSQYVLCEMTSAFPFGVLPSSSVYDINRGKYQYTILKY